MCGSVAAQWLIGSKPPVADLISSPKRTQRLCSQVIKNTFQCCDIVLVFGAFERVLEHFADVVGTDPLHLPIRIQTLALFLALVQGDDIVMARIAMQARHQLPHLGCRPFDPLEEDAATENEDPSDAAGEIVALRRLDKAVDLGVVHAIGGTTAIYESEQRGRVGVIVRVAWKTGFVEHGLARFVYARQAVPHGW